MKIVVSPTSTTDDANPLNIVDSKQVLGIQQLLQRAGGAEQCRSLPALHMFDTALTS
jgi:hypothetical protein